LTDAPGARTIASPFALARKPDDGTVIGPSTLIKSIPEGNTTPGVGGGVDILFNEIFFIFVDFSF
jgi:hypothetical protein